MSDLDSRFAAMWAQLAPIGRRADGGYDRFAWSDVDLELRAWFRTAATARDLPVEQDRNGNLWAWWGKAAGDGGAPPGAVATGSHLDSVPGGGAFDGPLGVVSGFLALDELRLRLDTATHPVAVVDFTEEEGARFGVACLGSRLMTGAVDADRARGLVDVTGTTLGDAMRAAGADPDRIGQDDERLSSIAAFVELHVEQGRRLGDAGAPVGIATQIWPHGRWRLRFDGEANHAGTTRIEDRRDPMLPLAVAIGAARTAAQAHGGVATVGRVHVRPNAQNAVASCVEAWLDARGPHDAALGSIVADVRVRAGAAATDHGVRLTITEESLTPAVVFDAALCERVSVALGGAPELGTGAGHDAGILAERVPTAMLFVRNPTGVSHSPAEQAGAQDCVAGVRALASVLEELAWR